eukprot:tig00020510_g9828.t1
MPQPRRREPRRRVEDVVEYVRAELLDVAYAPPPPPPPVDYSSFFEPQPAAAAPAAAEEESSEISEPRICLSSTLPEWFIRNLWNLANNAADAIAAIRQLDGLALDAHNERDNVQFRSCSAVFKEKKFFINFYPLPHARCFLRGREHKTLEYRVIVCLGDSPRAILTCRDRDCRSLSTSLTPQLSEVCRSDMRDLWRRWGDVPDLAALEGRAGAVPVFSRNVHGELHFQLISSPNPEDMLDEDTRHHQYVHRILPTLAMSGRLQIDERNELKARGVCRRLLERIVGGEYVCTWDPYRFKKDKFRETPPDVRLPGVKPADAAGNELLVRECDPSVENHVPESLLAGPPGLFVPAVDIDERITMAIVKTRPGFGICRYWTPGSTRRTPFHQLRSGQIPLFVWRPKDPARTTRHALLLTEGGLKPLVVCANTGLAVIGAGIGSGGDFASSELLLRDCIQRLGTRLVIYCPDAGAVSNSDVAERALKTFHILGSLGDVQVGVAWWGQTEKAAGDVDDVLGKQRPLRAAPRFAVLAPRDFWVLHEGPARDLVDAALAKDPRLADFAPVEEALLEPLPHPFGGQPNQWREEAEAPQRPHRRVAGRPQQAQQPQPPQAGEAGPEDSSSEGEPAPGVQQHEGELAPGVQLQPQRPPEPLAPSVARLFEGSYPPAPPPPPPAPRPLAAAPPSAAPAPLPSSWSPYGPPPSQLLHLQPPSLLLDQAVPAPPAPHGHAPFNPPPALHAPYAPAPAPPPPAPSPNPPLPPAPPANAYPPPASAPDPASAAPARAVPQPVRVPPPYRPPMTASRPPAPAPAPPAPAPPAPLAQPLPLPAPLFHGATAAATLPAGVPWPHVPAGGAAPVQVPLVPTAAGFLPADRVLAWGPTAGGGGTRLVQYDRQSGCGFIAEVDRAPPAPPMFPGLQYPQGPPVQPQHYHAPPPPQWHPQHQPLPWPGHAQQPQPAAYAPPVEVAGLEDAHARSLLVIQETAPSQPQRGARPRPALPPPASPAAPTPELPPAPAQPAAAFPEPASESAAPRTAAPSNFVVAETPFTREMHAGRARTGPPSAPAPQQSPQAAGPRENASAGWGGAALRAPLGPAPPAGVDYGPGGRLSAMLYRGAPPPAAAAAGRGAGGGGSAPAVFEAAVRGAQTAGNRSGLGRASHTIRVPGAGRSREVEPARLEEIEDVEDDDEPELLAALLRTEDPPQQFFLTFLHFSSDLPQAPHPAHLGPRRFAGLYVASRTPLLPPGGRLALPLRDAHVEAFKPSPLAPRPAAAASAYRRFSSLAAVECGVLALSAAQRERLQRFNGLCGADGPLPAPPAYMAAEGPLLFYPGFVMDEAGEGAGAGEPPACECRLADGSAAALDLSEDLSRRLLAPRAPEGLLASRLVFAKLSGGERREVEALLTDAVVRRPRADEAGLHGAGRARFYYSVVEVSQKTTEDAVPFFQPCHPSRFVALAEKYEAEGGGMPRLLARRQPLLVTEGGALLAPEHCAAETGVTGARRMRDALATAFRAFGDLRRAVARGALLARLAEDLGAELDPARPPALVAEALTHSSATGGEAGSNERLEQVGDALLALCVRWALLDANKAALPRDLQQKFGDLTSNEYLQAVGGAQAPAPPAPGAAPLPVAHAVLRNTLLELSSDGGPAQDHLQPGQAPNLVSDAVEALLAAVALEYGPGALRAFVARHVFAGEDLTRSVISSVVPASPPRVAPSQARRLLSEVQGALGYAFSDERLLATALFGSGSAAGLRLAWLGEAALAAAAALHAFAALPAASLHITSVGQLHDAVRRVLASKAAQARALARLAPGLPGPGPGSQEPSEVFAALLGALALDADPSRHPLWWPRARRLEPAAAPPCGCPCAADLPGAPFHRFVLPQFPALQGDVGDVAAALAVSLRSLELSPPAPASAPASAQEGANTLAGQIERLTQSAGADPSGAEAGLRRLLEGPLPPDLRARALYGVAVALWAAGDAGALAGHCAEVAGDAGQPAWLREDILELSFTAA